MKKILPLFSYLFHPTFIPAFGTLLYLFYSENYFAAEMQYLILLEVVIITILIPISFFYFLKTIGKADSVMLSKLSQRKIPLAIQAILLAILLVKGLPVDRIPELYFFLLGGGVSIVIALILVFAKVKASIHMIGISTLTTFVIGISVHERINMLDMISFLILMNGIIAASRLQMKAHTLVEIAIGFFSGMLPQLLLWYFWL